jgi:hypothetical protein
MYQARPIYRTTVPPVNGCFAAGTLVHTKAGLVPIERIRIGDWVLSQPEIKGEQAYKRVSDTFVFEDKEVMFIDFLPEAEFERARATHTLVREETKQGFVVTPNHPFWLENVGWTRADELEPGTKVELRAGTLAYVDHLASIYPAGSADTGWAPFEDIDNSVGHYIDLRHGELKIESGLDLAPGFDRKGGFHTRVYNFEVEDFHTYYVGEIGVWVHNIDCRVKQALHDIASLTEGRACARSSHETISDSSV